MLEIAASPYISFSRTLKERIALDIHVKYTDTDFEGFLNSQIFSLHIDKGF